MLVTMLVRSQYLTFHSHNSTLCNEVVKKLQATQEEPTLRWVFSWPAFLSISNAMSKLPFEMFRTAYQHAWTRELFYSKYQPNRQYEWIDTDMPEHAVDQRDITYHFNEYGFRSDSFEQRTQFNILVSGDSLTVGVGTAYENTWPRQLKHIFERETLNHNVTVWNLAQSATSTDYTVRSIYKVLDQLAPDFVAVCWPPETRFEGPDGDDLRDYTFTHVDTEEYPRLFLDQRYAYHNLQKNVAFLTEICRSRDIPLVHGPGEHTMFGIDPRTGARDGQHPSDDWHREYAELVFEHWQDKY